MNELRGMRRPSPGEVPAKGTPEYAWWWEGASAEARARNDGRSKDGREIRDFVDSVAENWPERTAPDIAALAYDIFVLAGMPLRRRLRAALRVVRGRL